jgi:hypothetical protein
MNHIKIAAALHALADAFLEGADEQPASKPKGKAKPAAETAPAASVPAAPSTAAAEPAPAEPAPPPAPTVTLEQLNKAVLKMAAKHRDNAIAVLGRFGLSNTVGLSPDKWQAVYDAFEEEQAKIDAAAVKIEQASLV